MGIAEIITQLDREIALLQQARGLLTGKAVALSAAKQGVKKKRNLTPEGRKRIAEAVKRRWAEQKKAAAK